MLDFDRDSLLKMVFIAEGILICIAFILAFLCNINLAGQIIVDIPATLYALAGILVLTVVNILVVFVIPKFIPFLKPMREAYDELSQIAVNTDTFSIIAIAFITGLAEELLFRGVLQNLFGIIIASILFGCLHIINRKTIIYGFYAVLIGFFLGYLFILSQSLWTPILVHILNNAIAIPVMRHNYKKVQASKTQLDPYLD